jgi:protein TonB
MNASNPSFQRDDRKSLWLFVALVGLSMGGHAVAIGVLPSALERPPPMKRVEMEFYEPPPPPPPKEEEPPEEPKPLEPPKVKPPPVKVQVAEKAPAPKEDLPPPPNEEPPAEAPQEPTPIVVGISMSSTVGNSGFAVQVGNTTYGKASDKVTDPSQVKAYAAPKYAPPGSADVEPVPIGEVKVAYPEQAKSNEIEGSVRLKVTTDDTGGVSDVVIISGPGYGLNEAARDAMKRFKFRPAMKGGQNVAYTFIYTYTFLLD